MKCWPDTCVQRPSMPTSCLVHSPLQNAPVASDECQHPNHSAATPDATLLAEASRRSDITGQWSRVYRSIRLCDVTWRRLFGSSVGAEELNASWILDRSAQGEGALLGANFGLNVAWHPAVCTLPSPAVLLLLLLLLPLFVLSDTRLPTACSVVGLRFRVAGNHSYTSITVDRRITTTRANSGTGANIRLTKVGPPHKRQQPTYDKELPQLEQKSRQQTGKPDA